MQTARIVQAVIIMLVVAMAASCASTKEYTSKLFTPRDVQIKDTQALAIHFLDLDEAEINKENWVSTDIINGKDTTVPILALDKLAETIPVASSKKVKTDTVAVKTETTSAPVAKNVIVKDGVRSKRTRD
ncbi:MAG TPA: hypothetical protein PLU37_08890 [Chitinophagaceae bacterium]|nr:hypothetical protein [Chitinophagaceae bacterium]MCB9056438.1 hypothetical protein [Chitinophagales bacterium]HPG11631.1 hypothetical protein [Chitinophagaceae bacterium]HRX94979.1 hypothetical protein [Chitinophagaceae bacterium]